MISIIIPVYKVEKYIEQCIDSVLAQTYTDLEIILIDDGSPDRCPDICDEYARRDSRIKVLHKKNGGLLAAWSDGVRISRGEYIGFVDSDDYIEPAMYETMLNTMDSQNADLVCCGYTRCFENGEKLKKGITHGGIYEHDSIRKYLIPVFLKRSADSIKTITVSRWDKLFERQLITDNLCYLDSGVLFGEDESILFAALLDSKKTVCLDNTFLYNYRVNDTSITSLRTEKDWQKRQLLFDVLFKIASAKGYGNKKMLWRHFIVHMYVSIERERDSLNNFLAKRRTIKNIMKSFGSDLIPLIKGIEKETVFQKLIYAFMQKKRYTGIVLTLYASKAVRYFRSFTGGLNQ